MADEKGETRRQRNQRFDQLSPDIEVPLEAGHLWEWFWGLNGRRRSGPEALSFAEVDAWRRLMHRPVVPFEVDALMAMDDAYLRAVREDQAAAHARQTQTGK